MFLASILCLVLTLFFATWLVKYKKDLFSEIEQLHKTASCHPKTIKAISSFNHLTKSAISFVQTDLESQNLLCHFQKRYPSPLSNQTSSCLENNRLFHKSYQLATKGICHQRFVLEKKVLMDEEDLKQLLSSVEQTPIFPFKGSENTAYLFFTTFNLSKYPLSFKIMLF